MVLRGYELVDDCLKQIGKNRLVTGLRMPRLCMRARKVLGLSPRISEAPFFPLTFQRVSSSIRTIRIQYIISAFQSSNY